MCPIVETGGGETHEEVEHGEETEETRFLERGEDDPRHTCEKPAHAYACTSLHVDALSMLHACACSSIHIHATVMSHHLDLWYLLPIVYDIRDIRPGDPKQRTRCTYRDGVIR